MGTPVKIPVNREREWQAGGSESPPTPLDKGGEESPPAPLDKGGEEAPAALGKGGEESPPAPLDKGGEEVPAALGKNPPRPSLTRGRRGRQPGIPLRRLGWNAQPVLSFNAQLQARFRTVVEGCDGSASIQDFVQKAILSYTIGGERIP